ncbi:MAG TPA: ubiquinone biosynthesis regulatory protein kinase UbiB [Gammaproteobacteria bacterium]|nr:ubiquinone biosynthesis regulatory protein kinase UbiB [Gammaproteobacteria bacterium]
MRGIKVKSRRKGALHQLYRLFSIQRVCIRYGLDELLEHDSRTRWLRVFTYFWPGRYLNKANRSGPLGYRLRKALEDLGPIFVKLGQMLSTRRDLLPDDIADELAQLQDNVPPFPSSIARQEIERALGGSVTALFSAFSNEPLASASIAQVHAATLPDGRNVVVKVLRPQIEKIISRDISLLYLLAQILEKYWADGYRLRPVEVIEEYEKTIYDELDLLLEAANGAQLRRNFLDSKLLYVPEIYWDYCRKNILVLERIEGIPVDEIETLKAAGVDMKKLGERGVEIFFTQVFRDNFFHADMHPGNIFISPSSPRDPQYIAIDFGIIGTLTEEDQRYLAENLLAFFHRDYKKVAELHLRSGWVPSDTRVDEFESAIRRVCEPVFGRPIKDISFGEFLLNLFQTARRFDMHVQPQLILLQKTLLNIEGLGRQLYPDLDLWETAKPFLEKWIKSRLGPKAALKEIRDQLPFWGEVLPQLPGLTYETLVNASKGRLEVRLNPADKQMFAHYTQQNNRRITSAIAGGTLLVCTFLFFLMPAETQAALHLLPWGLGAGSILCWTYAFSKRE